MALLKLTEKTVFIAIKIFFFGYFKEFIFHVAVLRSLMREEEQRRRDGEQAGWSTPRYRIDTGRNPCRTQTKENRKYENRDIGVDSTVSRYILLVLIVCRYTVP